MSNAFKPGDVVRLKSGGPAMTVTHLSPTSIESGVDCQWFSDKNKLKRGSFAPDALVAVEEEGA